MTAANNVFRALWKEGDTLTYLDLNMVVVDITDGDFENDSMLVEYLNSHDEIQEKTFYPRHLPALKYYNK